MGFLGKIFKNKQIVTIVALVACFAILVFAYRYRVDKAIRAVSVPIASRRLEPREEINDTCFETKKVAQSMLTKNVITNVKQLVGDEETPAKYVNYNTFIPEGSLFYTTSIVTWDQMPDSAWADIKEGYTLFSLPLKTSSSGMSYLNSVYPGDKIDLYFQGKDSTQKVFIGPLIKAITVLAVKDGSGKHIFKKSAEQRTAASLIFAVEDERFLYLQRALAVGGDGSIIPVPRNEGYTINEAEGDEKGSTFIEGFINANSRVSTDDAVTNKNTNINITN